MKTVLKTLFVAVLFFVVAESQAQISVGGGLWYGTDINNLGISANGKYAIDENWAAAASFTYFLKKDYVTWSALDFNANYTFTEIENVGSLYAIGGLGFTFWGWDVDDSELGIWGDALDTNLTKVGLNLGAGLNMDISEKMAVAPEVMYTIGDFGYLRIGAKIMFGL
jgi:opacity protein-like surface antigen